MVQDAGVHPGRRAVSIGRPSGWLMVATLVLGAWATVNILQRGALERMDEWASDIVGGWGLRESVAYPAIWVVTQVGGRVTILVVLAGLVLYLAWRRRVLLPLVRLLVALVLLTAVVYLFKWGVGRTAPGYHGAYFFHPDGASFPSGHVANAVLMWGLARWQAVEYGLPLRVQQTFWVLAVLGPVATGLAMVSLDFHWLTDAFVGACVGILLLGVVHALDALVLSRWVRARAGRSTA